MTDNDTDLIEHFIDEGFATVSRNPSDYEATTAWRHAIALALQHGRREASLDYLALDGQAMELMDRVKSLEDELEKARTRECRHSQQWIDQFAEITALRNALSDIAESAEKGWQGSAGLGRMARQALK